MKILFITNFYPPIHRGGYEEWCQEVAEGLRSRGHDVLILTSIYGCNRLQPPDPTWVRRELHMEMEFSSLRNAFQFFTTKINKEKENLTQLQEMIGVYSPDAVLIWGMWNFTRSLPARVEGLMPGRVAYYMGDYWPTLPSQFEHYWKAPPRNFLTGVPKLLLKPIALGILRREIQPTLQLEHVMFPSKFLRDEFGRRGILPQNPKIVYGAIDTSSYRDEKTSSKKDGKVSLLYVGRLTHEKGVHTAIEAAGVLVWEHGFRNVNLIIVGDGEPKYVNELHELVEKQKLGSFVFFLPAQPKEALPALYHQSDILLFTSIWAEPFGRVIVEAMASGVTVVGTTVGGAAEILVDNENALTFTPNNPVSLSRQLKRLIDSPKLRERLAEAGYQTAVGRFDIQRMTIEIESYLQALVN